MKAFILLLLTSCCAFSQSGMKDPFRKADGKFYDLRPYEVWRSGGEKGKNPLPDWQGWSSLRVFQVTTNGLMMEFSQLNLDAGYPTMNVFLLKNYPGQSNVVDGDTIMYFVAKREGNFKYVDTLGAIRTVAAWDYGIPFIPTTNGPVFPGGRTN